MNMHDPETLKQIARIRAGTEPCPHDVVEVREIEAPSMGTYRITDLRCAVCGIHGAGKYKDPTVPWCVDFNSIEWKP